MASSGTVGSIETPHGPAALMSDWSILVSLVPRDGGGSSGLRVRQAAVSLAAASSVSVEVDVEAEDPTVSPVTLASSGLR